MPIETHVAKTTCRVKIPQCQTRSAFERNFIAAAISRNPTTTLTEIIQPPDFGSCERNCGAKARKKNGTANTVEKASMPASGHRQFPCAVMTNNVPTNGAVQVNDVSVKVEPIKRAPTTLLVSLRRVSESSLFVSASGTRMK